MIGYNFTCTNITIQNCTLVGTHVPNDYNACILLSNTWDRVTIRNNYICSDTATGFLNTGIQVFNGANNCFIYGNEISHCNRGFYYKRSVNNPAGHFEIKNNFFHDIFSHAIDLCADSGIVENNLIYNCQGAGISIYGENSGRCTNVGAFYNYLNHNSIISCNYGFFLGYTDECPDCNAKYTNITNNFVCSANKLIISIWENAPESIFNKDATRFSNNLYYSHDRRSYYYIWEKIFIA